MLNVDIACVNKFIYQQQMVDKVGGRRTELLRKKLNILGKQGKTVCK